MEDLKEGDKAPPINAKDENGDNISLAMYEGKKVVLYFYPKDDTPGCTANACDFRDNYQGLISKDIVVIGVSVDDEKSHQKFKTKHSLSFPLIADTDHKVVTDYGVWGEKSMYGKNYMGISRTTFVIDKQGIIEHIIKKVDTKNATKQILELVES